jgi:hypothetical protein
MLFVAVVTIDTSGFPDYVAPGKKEKERERESPYNPLIPPAAAALLSLPSDDVGRWSGARIIKESKRGTAAAAVAAARNRGKD